MNDFIYGVPKQHKQHRYPNKRKHISRSKRDQESICAVRQSAGLSCRNCKYYQHKYCLYDHGLTID